MSGRREAVVLVAASGGQRRGRRTEIRQSRRRSRVEEEGRVPDEKKKIAGEMVDDRDERGKRREASSPLPVESGGEGLHCSGIGEEEYAAARKSRPIFQRGTIARLSDRATT